MSASTVSALLLRRFGRHEIDERIRVLGYFGENADNDEYTLVGYVDKFGKTGDVVEIPEDGEGATNYTLFPVPSDWAKYPQWFDKYFVFNKTKTMDANAGKTIAGDGSTVSHLYFERRVYTLILAGNPSRYKTDQWFPDIERGGVIYNRDNLLTVHARYGQTLDALLPKTEEIVNMPANYVVGHYLATGTKFFWFPETGPYVLNHAMCFYAPQDTVDMTSDENHPRVLWIALEIEREDYKLVVHEAFQDVDGTYSDSLEWQTSTTTLEGATWFYSPNIYPGFTGDRDKMTPLQVTTKDNSGNITGYKDPTRLFVIKRDKDDRARLSEGDRFLDPKDDNTVILTEDQSWNRDSNGTVYVYYARNQYPLKVYFMPGEPDAANSKTLYYEALISEALPSLEVVQENKPEDIPEEYVFKGWYTDVMLTTPLQDSATMPAKQQEVYAKWGPPEGEIEVTVDADNGTKPEIFALPYGDKLDRESVGTPEKPGHTFIGWYLVEAGETTTRIYDFSKPVTRAFTIRAKWQENVYADLTVKYVDESGNDLLAPLVVKNLRVGLDFTYKAELVSGMLPDKLSKKLTLDPDSDKNVLVFVYKPFTTVDYRIRYVTATLQDDGTLKEQEIAPTKTVTTNKNIDTQNYMPIEGYMPQTLQRTLQLSMDPAENVMVFTYMKDAPNIAEYRVEYYFDKDGSGKYLLDTDRTLILSGELGETVTLSEDLRPPYLDNCRLNLEKSTISGVITSFSTLYLRVYYDGAPEPTETETEPTETTPPSTTVTSPATSPTTPTPPKTGELPNAS
ncbi:MAG TPA: InlB B-repeat-containing protein, partial [Fastidiosipila sp.]|nr:InlB B-repeat-containing protein [Fastidiosipila sp.]